ncbi:Acyl-CoA N-acyltransferase [Penicillium majusculum]|nr:Acyl-CoA N-acyltransferase [Penicillium majusculum]
MSFSLTTVVASDAECLIRDCDFPAMQDHPIRLTMFPRSCPETQEEEIRRMANGFRHALEKDSFNYRKVCTDDGTPVGFAGWSLLNKSATRDDHSQGGQTEVHNPDPETLDMDTVSKVSKILKEQDRILDGRWDIWPQRRCCESSVSASGYRLYANAMGMR